METILWYLKPSMDWMEGLPIGNGRLAAMITGNMNSDILTLNHEWLWRGVHRTRENIYAADMLEQVRKLLKSGDFFRATGLANICFAGKGGISGLAHRVDAYQPAGELHFQLDGIEEFVSRRLDIENGITTVERRTGKGSVCSCFIAHPVINNIICRWNGDISGVLSYSRTMDKGADERCVASKNGIVYKCDFHGGISFKVNVTIQTDGKVTLDENRLRIADASELMAFVNIATEVDGIEVELSRFAAPVQTKWNEILLSHKNSFSAVMNKFALEIDLPENHTPTDERIAAVKNGKEDFTLPLLYFNYGRYLLVSSSICGELPANLQGKWNEKINPPWDCDYHFDINLQMNYWMAEAANMSECTEALFKFVERFISHGKKAAKDIYGCRGIYLPLQTDAWGRATPESYGWAVWIGAAPWIAQHFWRHYEYTGDKEFLKGRAYPVFKEIARFYEDYLVEDEDGVMQIMPSQSPENRFEGTGMFPVSIGVSSAIDVQLAYDALGYAIEAAKILNTDENEIELWESLKNKLPDFRIGSDGRLLEWDTERLEVEPGHRHLSHLYGLYPSNLFNPAERPEQYAAAAKSLEYRLLQGGGHTGWSRAWVACLYARLGNSKQVWEQINGLIVDFATISLLDLHPPKIFQIDGNLGAVAAVIESLAQYWGGKLHLLYALPKVWENGRVRGLKVPGGHSIDMEWKNGRVNGLKVVLGYKKTLVIDMDGMKDIVINGKSLEVFNFIF